MKQEDTVLAGVELGRLVPAYIRAAGETHDHLLRRVTALDNLVDIDHGLLPYRSVLADRFGRPATRHCCRASSQFLFRQAHSRHGPRNDEVSIGHLGERFAGFQAAHRVVGMATQARDRWCRGCFVAD